MNDFSEQGTVPYPVSQLTECSPFEQVQKIYDLHCAVQGAQGSLRQLAARLEGKKNACLFVAHDADRPVAYKLGYELQNDIYYSWIGGVHEQYRHFGLARELMRLQHEWLQALGYAAVRTESSNRRKEMLILNLRSGFDIIGTFIQGAPDNQPRILFEKRLAV